MTGPRMTPEQLDAIQARRESYLGGCSRHDDCLRADVAALLALVREQQARIGLVRELHRPFTHHFLSPPAGSLEVCHSCRESYPCPTIAALTATEGA